MQADTYLTTEDAARYLRLSERKLYELIAAEAIPATKVTGRWLFPRAALDRWLEAGLGASPPVAPPLILGGSHDPLLEWLVRRSGAGLALLAEGSSAGLDRLAANEVLAAAVHLHAPGLADATIDAVAHHPGLADAVVIGFARREQGLVVAGGNPRGLTSVADAQAQGCRFAERQAGAGAQLLLQRLATGPVASAGVFATGSDLALAVRAGEADCGIATRAVAHTAGLGFVPITWEHFDIVLRRRSYFEPAWQCLMAAAADPDLQRQAARLGGYDLAPLGQVRFNR